MVHYLIIRRDLPFGVTLAQLAHAAANSMADYIVAKTEDADGMFYGTIFPEYKGMTVVVLGVRSLNRLRKAAYRLEAKGVKHTIVREPDQPWNGQMMAVGIWPHEDTPEFRAEFENYELYKKWEGEDEQEEEPS